MKVSTTSFSDRNLLVVFLLFMLDDVHPHFQMKGGAMLPLAIHGVRQPPVDSAARWRLFKPERDAAAVTAAQQRRSNGLQANKPTAKFHSDTAPPLCISLSLKQLICAR